MIMIRLLRQVSLSLVMYDLQSLFGGLNAIYKQDSVPSRCNLRKQNT